MDRSYDKTGGAVLTVPPAAYSLKKLQPMHVHNTL